MIEVSGSQIEACAFFTYEKLGVTGLTVTVDIHDQDWTLIINGEAASEGANGWYYYKPDPDIIDTKGGYHFTFKTAGTVDVNHIPAFWWIRGTADLNEPGDGSACDISLAGLRYSLRGRLDDLNTDGEAGGSYSTKMLDRYINWAYTESVFRSKCHKATETVVLTEAVHTYSLTNIFKVTDAILSTATDPLAIKEIGDQGVSIPTWNSTASGTPVTLIRLTGDDFRIHPAPNAAAALLPLYVTGPAYPDCLTNDSDTPDALPTAFAASAILDRAECFARRRWPSHSDNMQLSNVLESNWECVIKAIEDAVGTG